MSMTLDEIAGAAWRQIQRHHGTIVSMAVPLEQETPQRFRLSDLTRPEQLLFLVDIDTFLSARAAHRGQLPSAVELDEYGSLRRLCGQRARLIEAETDESAVRLVADFQARSSR